MREKIREPNSLKSMIRITRDFRPRAPADLA
jgi:hypothetical protein